MAVRAVSVESYGGGGWGEGCDYVVRLLAVAQLLVAMHYQRLLLLRVELVSRGSPAARLTLTAFAGIALERASPGASPSRSILLGEEVFVEALELHRAADADSNVVFDHEVGEALAVD